MKNILSLFFLLGLSVQAGVQQVTKLKSVSLTTSIQSNATYMVANWSQRELYVSNSKELLIVSTNNWSVMSHIPLTLIPQGMCFSDSAGLIATINIMGGVTSGAKVEIIDLHAGGASRIINTGVGFYGMSSCSFSNDARTLYLAANIMDAPGWVKLLSVDTNSGAILNRWSTPDKNGFANIKVLPNGKVYILAQYNDNTGDLRVLEGDDINKKGTLKTINVGMMPTSISFSPDIKCVYLTGVSKDSHMTVLDTQTDQILNTVPGFSIGNYGYSFPYSKNSRFAYTAGVSGFAGLDLLSNVSTLWNDQTPDMIYGISSIRQPDETDIVVLLKDGHLDIFEIISPKPPASVRPPRIRPPEKGRTQPTLPIRHTRQAKH